jgi:hypothetical protein
MAVPNRLAREGETLIIHRFQTGSMGLASPSEFAPIPKARPEARTFWTTVKSYFDTPASHRVTAVCIPPGTSLILHEIPAKLQSAIVCGSDELGTFTQITSTANAYRDAIRFSTGHVVRLQDLLEGQRVEVLHLDVAEERELNLDEFAL